jgi:hypothetical protein
VCCVLLVVQTLVFMPCLFLVSMWTGWCLCCSGRCWVRSLGHVMFLREGGSCIMLGMGWGVMREGVYFMWSNIGLCTFVKMSFICSFCIFKLCTWKRSKLLRNWPFFFLYSISIVSSIVLHVWSGSSMCWAYSEACSCVLTARIYSLLSLSNIRILVDIHYILVGILRLNSICLLFVLWILCDVFIVLVVLEAISMSVLLNNFVIILVSGP